MDNDSVLTSGRREESLRLSSYTTVRTVHQYLKYSFSAFYRPYIYVSFKTAKQPIPVAPADEILFGTMWVQDGATVASLDVSYQGENASYTLDLESYERAGTIRLQNRLSDLSDTVRWFFFELIVCHDFKAPRRRSLRVPSKFFTVAIQGKILLTINKKDARVTEV